MLQRGRSVSPYGPQGKVTTRSGEPRPYALDITGRQEGGSIPNYGPQNLPPAFSLAL